MKSNSVELWSWSSCSYQKEGSRGDIFGGTVCTMEIESVFWVACSSILFSGAKIYICFLLSAGLKHEGAKSRPANQRSSDSAVHIRHPSSTLPSDNHRSWIHTCGNPSCIRIPRGLSRRTYRQKLLHLSKSHGTWI